ncbi:hypothetical protein KUTeg_017324 [Tegillarca granosa]|uniref:Uncharacterized protein n=1 Tax=Tegillarca granosa TaxID=220873 RepID=A0ABQ9EIM4_TEGGR|nr:hypothetical protein KUTeg_017324 [Tegillarca granosa]
MSFMIPPIIALLIAAVERHEIRYHLCHAGLLSAAFLYLSKINPVYFLTAYGVMMAFTILLSIKCLRVR